MMRTKRGKGGRAREGGRKGGLLVEVEV